VTLSKYAVELQEDRKHLREVSNPRLADTPFRSPQLTLIDIGPHEWLLYWRLWNLFHLFSCHWFEGFFVSTVTFLPILRL
jgi:hypothetical protein